MSREYKLLSSMFSLGFMVGKFNTLRGFIFPEE
jgi:hypothetical protein